MLRAFAGVCYRPRKQDEYEEKFHDVRRVVGEDDDEIMNTTFLESHITHWCFAFCAVLIGR